MHPRPFLRAYMAGTLVPTLFLLVIMSLDAYHRFYFEVPTQFVLGISAPPLERAALFPMAIVPNLWGLWNMLYLATKTRTRLSPGAHGSLLVLLLVPGGVALARLLDVFTIQPGFALPIIPIGMAVYYLAWKYVVEFLNREMGIA